MEIFTSEASEAIAEIPLIRALNLLVFFHVLVGSVQHVDLVREPATEVYGTMSVHYVFRANHVPLGVHPGGLFRHFLN